MDVGHDMVLNQQQIKKHKVIQPVAEDKSTFAIHAAKTQREAQLW